MDEGIMVTISLLSKHVEEMQRAVKAMDSADLITEPTIEHALAYVRDYGDDVIYNLNVSVLPARGTKNRTKACNLPASVYAVFTFILSYNSYKELRNRLPDPKLLSGRSLSSMLLEQDDEALKFLADHVKPTVPEHIGGCCEHKQS